MKLKLLLLLWTGWSFAETSAQNLRGYTSPVSVPEDSTRVHSIIPAAYAIGLYKTATELSQYLYSGGRYHIYDRAAKTHQFFKTDELQDGYLLYDGREYGPLRLYYDTHWGLIVAEQPANRYLVQLQSSKVQAFRMGGHSFVRMTGDPVLKDGFYDQLYDGPTRVICARKKERREEIVGRSVIVSFDEKDRFYLKHRDMYYEITSKKRLLNLLVLQKSAIRKHFRNTGTLFRQDKEQAVLAATQLYDRLNAHP